MTTFPAPLTVNLLRLIALFEGSSGGRINVWDEQYLSLGTLHFAVRMGPGVTFLLRVRALDPQGFRAALGVDFDRAAGQGSAALVEFCRRNVWKSGERWVRPFQSLSRLPAYAQADAEGAAPYLASAVRKAERYGLTSERGAAFALDRCVQQGGAFRPGVDAAHARVRESGEVVRMRALAEAYAASANPKYRDVVLKRSLTVALGTSRQSGYPGNVDLERDFGLSTSRAWKGGAPAAAPAGDCPKLFITDDHGKTAEWNGDESLDFGGKRLTRDFLRRVAAMYPRGADVVHGGLRIVVHPDGALQFWRAP